MSERQLYRRIQEFKDLGFPIEYCKECECYQYTKPVKIWFEVKIDEETAMKIKGGQNLQKYWEDQAFLAYPEINRNTTQTLTSFFAPLPNYGSEPDYL